MCVKGLFSLPYAQITRGGDKLETDAREATTENPGRISTAWRTLQVSPPVTQTLLRRARKDGEQRDILEIRSCAVLRIRTRATPLSQQCWQGVEFTCANDAFFGTRTQAVFHGGDCNQA